MGRACSGSCRRRPGWAPDEQSAQSRCNSRGLQQVALETKECSQGRRPNFRALGSVSGSGLDSPRVRRLHARACVHAAYTLDGDRGPLHGKVRATPGSPGMTQQAAPALLPATLLVARRLWVSRTLGPRRTEVMHRFP